MLREKLNVLRASRPLSFYWILMWSLSYIVCFIIKPDLVYGASKIQSLAFPSLGLILLTGLLLNVKALIFVCGLLEVLGGVASWTGVLRWNVVWTVGYDPLAQISMALLDLVSAVFLFKYSLEVKVNVWELP